VEKRTRVVVYGSALHMAGMQASLKAEPDLEVLCVDPHAPTAGQRLNELHPAVIAFDLTDPSLGLDVTLLREQPGLLLIGVDPSSDELLVLSCRPAQALCVADLVNVIRQKDSDSETSQGERKEVTNARI
jgi:hypothetical protein